MIRRFRHKGLKLLFEEDDRRKVRPDQAEKITRFLLALDAATGPDEMALPGFRLHPSRGDFAGFWAISVSATGGSSGVSTGPILLTWDLIDYH